METMGPQSKAKKMRIVVALGADGRVNPYVDERKTKRKMMEEKLLEIGWKHDADEPSLEHIHESWIKCLSFYWGDSDMYEKARIIVEKYLFDCLLHYDGPPFELLK